MKKQYLLKFCLFFLLGAFFYVSGGEKNDKGYLTPVSHRTSENLNPNVKIFQNIIYPKGTHKLLPFTEDLRSEKFEVIFSGNEKQIINRLKRLGLVRKSFSCESLPFLVKCSSAYLWEYPSKFQIVIAFFEEDIVFLYGIAANATSLNSLSRTMFTDSKSKKNSKNKEKRNLLARLMTKAEKDQLDGKVQTETIKGYAQFVLSGREKMLKRFKENGFNHWEWDCSVLNYLPKCSSVDNFYTYQKESIFSKEELNVTLAFYKNELIYFEVKNIYRGL